MNRLPIIGDTTNIRNKVSSSTGTSTDHENINSSNERDSESRRGGVPLTSAAASANKGTPSNIGTALDGAIGVRNTTANGEDDGVTEPVHRSSVPGINRQKNDAASLLSGSTSGGGENNDGTVEFDSHQQEEHEQQDHQHQQRQRQRQLLEQQRVNQLNQYEKNPVQVYGRGREREMDHEQEQEHEHEQESHYREMMATGAVGASSTGAGIGMDGGGNGMYYEGDTPSIASTSVHGRDSILMTMNAERERNLALATADGGYGSSTAGAGALMGMMGMGSDSFRGGTSTRSGRNLSTLAGASAGASGQMSRDMMAMMMREEGLRGGTGSVAGGFGMNMNSMRGERDFYSSSSSGRMMMNTRAGTNSVNPSTDYLLQLSPRIGMGRGPLGSGYNSYLGGADATLLDNNVGDVSKSPGNNISSLGLGGPYSPHPDGGSIAGPGGSSASQIGSPSITGAGKDGSTSASIHNQSARGLARAMMAADGLPISAHNYPMTAKEQAEIEREEELLLSLLIARRQRSRNIQMDDLSDGASIATRSQMQFADDLVRLRRDRLPRGGGTGTGESATRGATGGALSTNSGTSTVGAGGSSSNNDISIKDISSTTGSQGNTGGSMRTNRRVSPSNGSVSSTTVDPMNSSARGMTNIYANEHLLGMDFPSGAGSLGSLYSSSLMGMNSNDYAFVDSLPSRRDQAMTMMGSVGSRAGGRSSGGLLGSSNLDPLGISQSSTFDLYGVGPNTSRYDYLSGSMSMSLSGSGSRRRAADAQLYNDPYGDMMLLSNTRRSGAGGIGSIDRRLHAEYGSGSTSNSNAALLSNRYGGSLTSNSKYQQLMTNNANRNELLPERRTQLSPSNFRSRMMQDNSDLVDSMSADRMGLLDTKSNNLNDFDGGQLLQYNRRGEGMMSMNRANNRGGADVMMMDNHQFTNRVELQSQIRGMKRPLDNTQDPGNSSYDSTTKSMLSMQQPVADDQQAFKNLVLQEKEHLQEQQGIVIKPKRTHKKKPADMPRRPLSAYNLFFSEERERILSELKCPTTLDGEHNKEGVAISGDAAMVADEISSEPVCDAVQSAGPKALLRPLIPNQKKRRPHRKTHGAISFQELARMVGQRWKDLPEDRRKYYKDLAEDDYRRQKVAMEEYAAKQHNSIKPTSESTETPQEVEEDAVGTSRNDVYRLGDDEEGDVKEDPIMSKQSGQKKQRSDPTSITPITPPLNSRLINDDNASEGKVDAGDTIAKKWNKDHPSMMISNNDKANLGEQSSTKGKDFSVGIGKSSKKVEARHLEFARKAYTDSYLAMNKNTPKQHIAISSAERPVKKDEHL